MGASGIVNTLMRGLQFLWALLVMALIGDMIASSPAGDPATVNYSMFCAVFAMLSLFYLLPASFMDSLNFHPILPVALDTLNAIFWFCAAVAMAAGLNVQSCSNDDYVNRNNITNGSENRHSRCREAQAATAFLWFGFAAFAVSAVLSGLGSRGSANMKPRGPAMSKV